MEERPIDLDDADVIDALGRAWGVDVVALEHLPVGFGGHHWKATGTDGAPWFVSVTALHGDRDAAMVRLRAALRAAHQLHGSGLDLVVAPVPAANGELVHLIDGRHPLSLAPFVAGTTFAFGDVLPAAERMQLVEGLARLHGASAPAVLVRRPDARRRQIESVLVSLDGREAAWAAGPFGEPARALLADQAAAIEAGLARFDALAAQVEGRGPGVVTHGEPHPGNVLAVDGGVVLVDWDTVAIAVPERDLWLVGGDLDRYTELTGHEVDPAGLALYRLQWAIEDLVIGAEVLRAPHANTPDARTEWAGFTTAVANLTADG